MLARLLAPVERSAFGVDQRQRHQQCRRRDVSRRRRCRADAAEWRVAIVCRALRVTQRSIHAEHEAVASLLSAVLLQCGNRESDPSPRERVRYDVCELWANMRGDVCSLVDVNHGGRRRGMGGVDATHSAEAEITKNGGRRASRTTRIRIIENLNVYDSALTLFLSCSTIWYAYNQHRKIACRLGRH